MAVIEYMAAAVAVVTTVLTGEEQPGRVPAVAPVALCCPVSGCCCSVLVLGKRRVFSH